MEFLLIALLVSYFTMPGGLPTQATTGYIAFTGIVIIVFGLVVANIARNVRSQK